MYHCCRISLNRIESSYRVSLNRIESLYPVSLNRIGPLYGISLNRIASLYCVATDVMRPRQAILDHVDKVHSEGQGTMIGYQYNDGLR